MCKGLRFFAVLAAALVTFAAAPRAESRASAQRLTISLWPHGAPGGTNGSGPEKNTTGPHDDLVAGRSVIRLTNVSNPTITLYKPGRGKSNGAAVVVFPGGAYRILAMDLEGTEVCAWLNSIGVTAVLLKYRVPPRKGLPRYTAPLQDAQRVLGLVRYHARDWGIDPNRIGVLGFSAGGDLAALLSNNFARRTYKPIGPADRVSCRPNFTMLVYPAYLVLNRQGCALAPELKVTANTPPTFLVQTEDDPIGVDNSICYYLALKKANVPAEMHIYPVGGHGYGLRPTKAAVSTWPERAAAWLRGMGVLRGGE